MTKALADIFAAAQAPRIDWDGAPAYAIYELSPAPEHVRIEFLNSKDNPVQGLTLKANGGILVVNHIETSEMIFWRDTAPDVIDVQVKPKRSKNFTLKFWNVWRGTVGGVGASQAWLGNSGMRIDQSNDSRELILHCSDGEGPIDFRDLEARLIIS
jgi:hypothetical protein